MAHTQFKPTRDGIPTERSPLLDAPTSEDNANCCTSTIKSPEQEQLSTSRLVIILGSIWMGCFLNAIDTTIIASLAVPISDDFHSLELLSWFASSFMIAQTTIAPLSGRLTDIFGRRAGLICAHLAFGVGTLMCGLATSVWMMILGRAIAGMGGGALNSISAFIATDLIPLRQRGLWQGVSNIMWGVGAGLGGFYGGWIHDIIGWRWAFLIQVPLLFVSTALVIRNVPVAPSAPVNRPKLKRIDFFGSFLLVLSLVLLLLGLTIGGNLVSWFHPLVMANLFSSLILALSFVFAEIYIASEPIIPIPLLINRTIAASCLTNMLDTMIEYVLHFYGPIYFQILGFSATRSGTILIPQAVGVVFGSIIAGYIMRVTGRYWTLNVVLETLRLGAAIGLVLFSSRTAPTWPIYAAYGVAGFCYAGMLTTALVALVSAVDHAHQALVTSASYTFRYMGSALGVSVSSAVFQNVVGDKLWCRFAGRPGAEDIIEDVRKSLDSVKKLPPEWRDDVLSSYMAAVTSVWVVVGIISVLALGAAMVMREHRLHSTLSRK